MGLVVKKEAACRNYLYSDFRADRAPDQFLHPCDQEVCVGGLGSERLPAREGE
jgi:hypothetical protein